MAQRNYRDPIHNIISLDESVADDRLIVQLIDSAEFQRLRRIKQLGLAMFTYQGAEHSRFTHSIGVMHLMTRVLDLLGLHHKISEEARAVGRAGALLHDLGHGPFSHVIEKVFGFHHEDWTCRIIQDPGTEVNNLLKSFDDGLPNKLESLYRHGYKPAYISQLVSSQLDCDRMDYLLRDSLMTGAKYGMFDSEWILHALKVDEQCDRVYVEGKGLHAVEEYLHARYYMFRQVYFHRTLRSAEAVLVSILNRARVLLKNGTLKFRMGDSPFERLLIGEGVTPQAYLQLDDIDLTFHVKQWAGEDDPILADLARRFMTRRLFKAMDVDVDGEAFDQFQERAREVIREAGFDPEYYLMMDRAGDVPYYGYYAPASGDPAGSIYVEAGDSSGQLREISEVSDVVRGLRVYRIDRVCFPTECTQQISALLSGYQQTAGGAA